MLNTLLISERFKTLLLALGLGAIAAFLGGWLGFGLGYRSAEAKGETALASLQQAQAEALTAATQAARRQLLDEVEQGNRLARELVSLRTQHAEEKQSLLRRIDDVTRVYIPAAGQPALPLPTTVFTAGFLREYNTAIGLPATDAGTFAGGAGDAASASTSLEAWLLDSGLSQADILAHIADYGERCRNLETQLNRLIDFEEAMNGRD